MYSVKHYIFTDISSTLDFLRCWRIKQSLNDLDLLEEPVLLLHGDREILLQLAHAAAELSVTFKDFI